MATSGSSAPTLRCHLQRPRNTVPCVTDSSADPPVLSAAETRVAESLLASPGARAWWCVMPRRSGIGATSCGCAWPVTTAPPCSSGPGRGDSGDRSRGFDAELAALQFLSPMETAVAPRLLGADASAGILIMEDLGPGSSLADSLMAGDRGRVGADLISYARTIAAMHAWSIGRSREYGQIRARLAGSADAATAPDWMDAIAGSKEPFLAMATHLGLATDGVDREIDSLGPSWPAPATSASCTATCVPTTRISRTAAAGSSTSRPRGGDPLRLTSPTCWLRSRVAGALPACPPRWPIRPSPPIATR